ncbi:Tfp pilus assembly protein FimT [Candidatus Rubidus massiliensis]|nr:Tfp pilus assembly protein FimT [Candidatus Rubidus massiliensis]
MIKKRFLFFSLLEMMIAFSFLAIIASFAFVKIQEVVTKQKFNNEVYFIAERLRFAQNLMLMMNKDIKITFESLDNKQIKLTMQILGQNEEPWMSKYTKPYFIKTIRYINFPDTLRNDSHSNSASIFFMSKGFYMSKALLYLSTGPDKPNSLNRYIPLKGIPAKIEIFTNEEQAKKHSVEDNTTLKNFSQQTLKEIVEKIGLK